MIETAKVKKQMRLDELIKYIFESDAREKTYYSVDDKRSLSVDWYGVIRFSYGADSTDTFAVEVEEPITESTVFRTLVDVNNNDEVHIAWNDSISLYDKEQTKEIHAIIDGKLKLIWEAE